METIALYWGALLIAYYIATRTKNKEKLSRLTLDALNIIMYLLILMMSLRMGANKEIIDSLAEIGIQSLIISFITVACSMLAVTFTRFLLHLDRKGNKKGSVKLYKKGIDSESTAASEGLKSSLVIVLIVAAGMLAGYFLIYRKLGVQDDFLQKTDVWMTILLVALIFAVGFSLGLKGNMIASLKKAGVGVILFPAAAIIGTVIGGLIYYLISPMGIRESVAIAYGFGWYTYAPTVIAQAGYPVASAISFLHNAIRETFGIIAIPFIAAKIGYIESTAVPGVAAWDVCMPIVEQHTNEDTVIYSFATGCMMFITIPVVIPLVLTA